MDCIDNDELIIIGSSVVIILMRIVDSGGVIHEWGQRVYGKFLYVQLDFVVNLKLHLKSLLKKQ